MDRRVDEQLEVFWRGVEAIYSESELAEKIARSVGDGRPLRVKYGMDPTAPDIHLGHSVQLRKLRQFQDFGHKAVLIIGDFTAMIGDPSGRSKTRPLLSTDEITKNAATYLDQAGKILLTDSDRIEIRHNSEWLAGMTFADVLKLAGTVTVGQMLKRDDFRKRFEGETPIGVHEMMYPLMQGHDSVVVESDVELGGTDQTFNNLVGRDLQIQAGQRPQVVMVMPMLVGTDGVQKMSKSLGNYIGLTDEPKLMFERMMSTPDEQVRHYLTLLTDFDAGRIDALVDPSRTHPKQAKIELAKAIVTTYHDAERAAWAANEFDRVHAQRELPEELPTVTITDAGEQLLAKLLTQIGLVASNSEGKRMIKQGAVRVDAEPIKDVDARIIPVDGMVVQVGRRKFARVVVRSD